MQVYKRCPKCGKYKPLEDFYKNRSRKDGHSCYCKVCADIVNKPHAIAWKQKRREHYTELERNRCQRIKDEAGYHHKVETFYPGYRLIKALQDAEIVEI
jgi:hypothetical protein